MSVLWQRRALEVSAKLGEGSPEGPQLRRGSGQGRQRTAGRQDGFGMGSY